MPYNAGWINFKWPLRKFRRGFFEGNSTTISSVTEDIKTLLLTRRGERVVNTTLGSNISVFAGELFEQISVEEMKQRIANEIRDVLAEWMPHVKLQELNIRTSDDDPNLKDNWILIDMDYVLTNAEALGDSVQITLDRG